MKRNICIFIIAGLALVSCTNKLKELNINPNSPTVISPGPLMSYIQLQTAKQIARRSSIGFCMMMIQQTATTKTDDLLGDKYISSIDEGDLFNFTYSTLTPNISAYLSLTRNEPDKSNDYYMGLIWKVLVYSRVTDVYGDIPYSQAGKGYTNQIYKPKYDAQKDIYMMMLHQLDSAATGLDPSKPTIGAADIIYNGDVSKWKKLAYSLMLRLGMHLSKVDQNTAATWVDKAFQGGVIMDNADNCYITHVDKYDETQANPITFTFQKFNLLALGDIKISNTFLNYLKQTQDPRLPVYCSLPNGDASIAMQKGLPNGYNATTIQNYPGGSDLTTYSTFNTKTILTLDAPTFLVTSAENQLLLAEAAARSWISGQAPTYYNNAVKASMKQMSLYGVSIPNSKILAYLALNPYPVTGSLNQQVKTIACQYWVSTFLDGYASYANWRRTGYPTLTPVNYPGNASNGTIPRRLAYPQQEYSANPKNVATAVKRQGPDSYTTRGWWDVKK